MSLVWRMRLTVLPRRRARAIGVAVLVLAYAGVSVPADAQGFGWFGNLFGGAPRPAPGAPAYPGYGRPMAPPPYAPYAERPRHFARRPRTAEQGLRERQPKNASSFVYVFGGSMGQSLANGLDEALADRQDVAVLHRARPGTGLDDPEAFDWLKTVDAALAAGSRAGGSKDAAPDGGKGPRTGSTRDGERKPEPIDVGVVMIGSDDRGPIEENGKVLEFGSPAWTAAYRKRVSAIDEAFKRKGVPLVWVGLPIAKNDDVADDMAALNDIYRDVAAKDGATYVDSWEAFSDDDGDFAASGPDISGRTVRLRAPDGIGFTRAGARKLAHFVEIHVLRALDGKSGPALADKEASPAAAPGASRPKSASSAVENLDDLPRAPGGSLVSLPKADATAKGETSPKQDLGAEHDLGGKQAPDATSPARADEANKDQPSGVSAAPAEPTTELAVDAAPAHDGKTPQAIPTERADNPAWHPDAQP